MPCGLVASDLLQNLVGSPASGEKSGHDHIRVDDDIHHEFSKPQKLPMLLLLPECQSVGALSLRRWR